MGLCRLYIDQNKKYRELGEIDAEVEGYWCEVCESEAIDGHVKSKRVRKNSNKDKLKAKTK